MAHQLDREREAGIDVRRFERGILAQDLLFTYMAEGNTVDLLLDVVGYFE